MFAATRLLFAKHEFQNEFYQENATILGRFGPNGVNAPHLVAAEPLSEQEQLSTELEVLA